MSLVETEQPIRNRKSLHVIGRNPAGISKKENKTENLTRVSTSDCIRHQKIEKPNLKKCFEICDVYPVQCTVQTTTFTVMYSELNLCKQ